MIHIRSYQLKHTHVLIACALSFAGLAACATVQQPSTMLLCAESVRFAGKIRAGVIPHIHRVSRTSLLAGNVYLPASDLLSALATKKTEAQRERWNRAVVAVLAATRRDKDVSQDSLAERLGVSRDVVANIEAGRRRVEVSDLILIGRALDVEPEVLFGA
jgi:DNA-binding XRE family transcriptional regulator